MSQKKHKKRKPQTKATQNPMELQETEKTKKMKPAAWNLLWVDLIFLAVCQILASKEMMGETLSNIATIVGVVLLVVVLIIQYGPSDKKPKGPRL